MKILFILGIFFLFGGIVWGQTLGKNSDGYINISPQEAKKVMESDISHIILDVRTDNEFKAGHIPGAILIPYTELNKRAEKELPDKSQTILVYCRSGNRSKIASSTLVRLGYSDIREFGGIKEWQYEIEK